MNFTSKTIIFLFFVLLFPDINTKILEKNRKTNNCFSKEDLIKTVVNNAQVGINGYNLHPTIIISIPDSSNNKCSREYIFKDGEGGLWFYATLASNGKIKLEMGDRILLQYGYDYYGKKGAAYNNGYK